MDYLNIDHLKRIATWGGIVGAASIIMGAISIVLTLTVDPSMILSGIISIITGYLFYQTGIEASNIIASDDFTAGNVNELLNKYGKLLLIMGILTIISLVVLIPLIIVLISL
ncbi:hypothetical protein BN997_02237 [Oceanobacillus oncorhynchi]|uniref:Uncharacterized protein n=1 Tax=Oceanobacillus oncorhynchi TaxID=545501 RepID=A0A0A1MH36_9BACI|nr:DUF5362 family protein [Oceanobacillus oncorhynchi]CEI82373.1 hypothetical protein BN997_02237 [Oceanobacillus oncorhynchi]